MTESVERALERIFECKLVEHSGYVYIFCLVQFMAKVKILSDLLNPKLASKDKMSELKAKIKDFLKKKNIDISEHFESLAREMPELADWFGDEKLQGEIQIEISLSHWKIKEQIKNSLF